MKRVISALLCLLFCISTAYAVEVDYSTMDYEELIEQRRQLEMEITTRPESLPITLGAGYLVVG